MPKHILQPLPYSYDALEPYIDAKTMEIHHTKHHQAYVDKLNAALEKYPELFEKPLEELLRNINQVPEGIRQAVINHGGGHYNHSLFWKIMGPNKGLPAQAGREPKGSIVSAIQKSFGDFKKFKEEFTNAALGIFGSGWAWAIPHTIGGIKIITTPNQNNPLMDASPRVPILGLDMWEHAMYLKFQNRKNEYIEAWWNVVNWDEVNKNLEANALVDTVK